MDESTTQVEEQNRAHTDLDQRLTETTSDMDGMQRRVIKLEAQVCTGCTICVCHAV